MNNKIKIVELFAGVGGFRLAFERTSKKYETIWANQWEPGKSKQWAYDCYIKHFGINKNHVNEDISTVINMVPNHDLLVGGFPCQDYSVAKSNANGIEGKKGVLWWNINSIIIEKKPSFIILENVDRLIKSPSNQRGRDFSIMLRCFEDAGYNVEWRIINASDYGFAQRRKRIFIFAFKKEITDKIYQTRNQFDILYEKGFFAKSFKVEKNTNKESKVVTILNGYKDLVDISNKFSFLFKNSGSMIDGQVFTVDTIPIYKKPIAIKEILQKDNIDERYLIKDSLYQWEYLKGKKNLYRINSDGHIYRYSEGNIDFPDSLEKPARTILTSEGSKNRSSHVIFDKNYNSLRFLTPIECERLNGFDDEWTNTGMPNKFRYFCMGNALVVPVIQKIAKSFLKIWEEFNG